MSVWLWSKAETSPVARAKARARLEGHMAHGTRRIRIESVPWSSSMAQMLTVRQIYIVV